MSMRHVVLPAILLLLGACASDPAYQGRALADLPDAVARATLEPAPAPAEDELATLVAGLQPVDLRATPRAKSLAELDLDAVAPARATLLSTDTGDYTFAARPIAWFPILEGDINLEGIGGISSSLELEDDLDVEGLEPTPGGEVNLRLWRFDAWLSGFSFDVDSSELIANSITFGNINITIPTLVDSTFEVDSVRAAFGFSLISNDLVRFGPTAGVAWFGVTADLSATIAGLTVNEQVDEDVVVPFVGVHFEAAFGDFVITADGSVFFFDIDQFDAPFVDLTGMVTWRPFDHFGVFAGYRFIRFSLQGSDFGRDFSFDLRLHGPFVGGELRF